MKLKNWQGFRESWEDMEPNWDDSTYDPYESDTYSDPYYKSQNSNKGVQKKAESPDFRALKESLLDMFSRSGFNNVEISGSVDYFTLEITFKYFENLSDVLRVVELVKKIKDDILVDYEEDSDLWRSKSYMPLLSIDFSLKE
jgi:hypothetical protein